MTLHVLQRAALIGPPVVLATTADSVDDELARLGASAGVRVQRGPVDDVLARFVASLPAHTRYVLRITADCPLLDPALGRAVLEILRATGVDYVSNTIPPTFPDGLDVEAFTVDALLRAADEATRASDREHVTPFIKRSDGFRRLELAHDPNLAEHRWTVDDPSDLAFVRAVHQRLERFPPEERTSMYVVLRIVTEEPALRDLNRGTERDEGYRISVERERAEGGAADSEA